MREKPSDSYSDKGESFLYRWENIKDLRKLELYTRIEIAGEEKFPNNKFVFSFQIVNDELREKSIKALKHMATSQGAKLVKDDLF